ncbi:hypothetical protein [Roseibium sp. SCP14]|uniref:hypothetical protein n=1 Tax=Roseibium sp. SCP14 TaxID=3141375 RepID=UPI003338DA1F
MTQAKDKLFCNPSEFELAKSTEENTPPPDFTIELTKYAEKLTAGEQVTVTFTKATGETNENKVVASEGYADLDRLVSCKLKISKKAEGWYNVKIKGNTSTKENEQKKALLINRVA